MALKQKNLIFLIIIILVVGAALLYAFNKAKQEVFDDSIAEDDFFDEEVKDPKIEDKKEVKDPEIIDVLEKELTFETISTGIHSSYSDSSRKDFVIKNEKDVENVAQETGMSIDYYLDLDFSKEMAIAVFQGEQSSGGCEIEVMKLIEKNNVLEVYVRERVPLPGEIVTMVITSPYHIIKVERIDKPVEFILL